MSAELSLLCKANGGSIVWVDRAFGGMISFFNVCNLLFANLASTAVSVQLFCSYLPAGAQEFWILVAVRFGLLAVSVLVNLFGPKAVGGASLVICIVLWIPFFAVLIVLGMDGNLASVDFGAIMRDIPSISQVNWGVFVATVVWSLGNFDGVGALAGEVSGGRRVFLTGFLSTLPISYANYILPVLLCMIAVPDWRSPLWTAGGYVEIAGTIRPWLGDIMSAAASLAMFGQTVAGMAYIARQLWSCGVLGLLPRLFAQSSMSKDGLVHRPVVATITSAIGIFALAFLPFAELTQIFLLQRILTLLFEYGALLRLRKLEPDTPRPMTAPIPWLLGLPTLILGGFMLYFVRDIVVWSVSGGIEALIIILYVLMRIHSRYWGQNNDIWIRKEAISPELTVAARLEHERLEHDKLHPHDDERVN